MNDYGAHWPFWGTDGGCGDDEPVLPTALSAEVKEWAAWFERSFDYQSGWPDESTAAAHATEGRRLFHEIQQALPNDTITFQYWETAYRGER